MPGGRAGERSSTRPATRSGLWAPASKERWAERDNPAAREGARGSHPPSGAWREGQRQGECGPLGAPCRPREARGLDQRPAEVSRSTSRPSKLRQTSTVQEQGLQRPGFGLGPVAACAPAPAQRSGRPTQASRGQSCNCLPSSSRPQTPGPDLPPVGATTPLRPGCGPTRLKTLWSPTTAGPLPAGLRCPACSAPVAQHLQVAVVRPPRRACAPTARGLQGPTGGAPAAADYKARKAVRAGARGPPFVLATAPGPPARRPRPARASCVPPCSPRRPRLPMSMAKRLAFSRLRKISSGGSVMLLSRLSPLLPLPLAPHSAILNVPGQPHQPWRYMRIYLTAKRPPHRLC